MVANLSGIVPVFVTPMLADGEPDLDGIARLSEFLIATGVGGFWAVGSASEDLNLSATCRLTLVRELAKTVNGRVPIIAGTGQTRVDDILRFMDQISDTRIDGVHVIYYDVKQGDSRVVSELTRLADKAPLPIWLYHNQKRGKQLTKQMIEQLRGHPNIVGIKMGTYYLSDMVAAIRLATPDFQVIGAGGGQFFSMLTLGAKAHTSSAACLWPEEYLKILQLFQKGDIAGARAQQFKLIGLEESLPRTDNGEFAAEEKYVLSVRGLCQDHVNPAYRRLTDDEKAKARSALRNYGFSWAQQEDRAQKKVHAAIA